MIVLIDMDEVLVNFVAGACKVHGVTVEAVERYRLPGVWSIVEAIGCALSIDQRQPLVLSIDEFWQPIHEAGAQFWYNLEKLPWFGEVIDWAENNFDQWYIVSAPSRESCSYTGKVNWLKRELGRDFDKFFLTPHKEMLATPDRLLLDDRRDNLTRFAKHGGLTLLFPSKGNELAGLWDEPMNYVKQQTRKGQLQ